MNIYQRLRRADLVTVNDELAEVEYSIAPSTGKIAINLETTVKRLYITGDGDFDVDIRTYVKADMTGKSIFEAINEADRMALVATLDDNSPLEDYWVCKSSCLVDEVIHRMDSVVLKAYEDDDIYVSISKENNPYETIEGSFAIVHVNRPHEASVVEQELIFYKELK